MQFGILGPVEVADAGHRLEIAGGKQRALLVALLLQANRVVPATRLIDALWDEAPPETAGKALQVHVSQLRKALGHDTVVTRAPGYLLRVSPGALDLDRFEALRREAKAADAPVTAERLREALALWRGPALADCADLRFAAGDVARLEELRVVALEERIAADLELGHHAELVGELEGLVAEHPQRERLRGQLMLALYRSGRQADALATYQRGRDMLVEELGIEPGPELRELHEAILLQRPTVDRPQTAAPLSPGPPPPMRAPGCVGRDRELGELAAALGEALAGEGRLVLVSGEPGIGKSRLLDELAGEAADRGARVLVGRCWEAGGAPAYWPWVQVLRAYVAGSDPAALGSRAGADAGRLTTLVPELGELLADVVPASPGPSEDRFQLFDAVSSFLNRAAAAEPLAIFLDDLHAADASSLLLLRFAAGALAGAPVLIVGAYRDGELGGDHPLAATLPELTRAIDVRRVTLAGLAEPDTAELLETVTGEPPSPDLASRVQASTEGNPLFVVELARLLAGQPGDADAGMPLPEAVREAVGARVRQRSASCVRMLTVAAVLGREFDLEPLRGVSGLHGDELFDAIEEAVGARLIGDVPGVASRLRFSHVLIRDALYGELSPARRLRLHGEIAEALEQLYAADPGTHSAELAHHFLHAGDEQAERAMHYAERAGDRAASQLAYEEAVRHYRRALVLVEQGHGGPERRCELLLSLGEVFSRAGEYREAKQAFRRAATIATGAGDAHRIARAALGYGGRFLWARAGSDAALVPLLETSLAAVGDQDSPDRVRLLARLATALRDQPARERRERLSGEAVAMARRLGDSATLAYALDAQWAAVEGPDDVGQRIARADELLALAHLIGDEERAFQGHEYRLWTLWMLGDRRGVDVELDALSTIAGELQQPSQQWVVDVVRTQLALLEGRLPEAEELIAATAALGRSAQGWNAVVTERLQLFVLRREQVGLADLEETLRRSVHEYPALQAFPCALAHLYAETGREREAQTALDDLLARDLGHLHVDEEWLFGVSLLPDVCAFLADAPAAGRLYDLLRPYEALNAVAAPEAAFGSVARGLGVLATTLGRYAEAERHFASALVIERGMGAGPGRAHVERGLAAMLGERGETGDGERSRELAASAAATYRALGMDAWAARTAGGS